MVSLCTSIKAPIRRVTLRHLCKVVVCSGLTLMLAGQGYAKEHNSHLQAVNSKHFDQVKVADNAALPSNRHIYLNVVTADFDKDWITKFRGDTNKKYRQRITTEYADMLKGQLAKHLEKAGWTVFDTPQPRALSVTAQLKDLFINGPEQLNRQHVLVNSVGRASLLLTVSDIEGNAFFEIEDKRNAGGLAGSLFETDRAMNYSLFSRLSGNWASIFVSYLDLSTPNI